MDKLKRVYLLSPIVLLAVAIFAIYFAYGCYQNERIAKAQIGKLEAEFKQYKADSINIKKLESNIIEAIKHGQDKTDNLRNDIDNGISELLVKVESAERDSAAAGNTAQQALRLAKSARQDYFNLTNAIDYNKAIITGWQKYYCTEIAPKNKTEFMCDEVKNVSR